MIYFFIAYVTIINIIGFFAIYIDKMRAKKGQWRIREITFFIVAIFGGGALSIVSMYLCRHKTRHKSFTIGMPICTIIGIGFLVLLYKVLLLI